MRIHVIVDETQAGCQQGEGCKQGTKPNSEAVAMAVRAAIEAQGGTNNGAVKVAGVGEMVAQIEAKGKGGTTGVQMFTFEME